MSLDREMELLDIEGQLDQLQELSAAALELAALRDQPDAYLAVWKICKAIVGAKIELDRIQGENR